MKKEVVVTLMIFSAMFFVSLVAAESCALDVSMINQDPYPANPGDYVKVVFQIDGLSNPECGLVTFQVKEEFPFTVQPGTENPIEIRSGTYSRKYSSFYIAAYSILVDKDAIDGDHPIEVSYTSDEVEKLKEFNINVDDTRADFEIYVKDYDAAAKTLTFEILNIGENDIEALTLEIPKQDNIEIKGANRKVVGDLDSNEYTTAEFEATPNNGEIDLIIVYTDIINVRRELNKTVIFDSSYFTDRNGEAKSFPWFWVIVVLGVIAWIIYRKIRKNKLKKKRLKESSSHKH